MDGLAIGKQVHCLLILALLLREYGQLDAAGEAASYYAIDLSENRDQYQLRQCHHLLGDANLFKGNTEKAIHHFEASLRIASSQNLRSDLFGGHLALIQLYIKEGKLNDAYTHAEQTKSHAGDDMLLLARAFYISARVLYGQHRIKEAKLEALRVFDIFEKLGATDLGEHTRRITEEIEEVIHKLDDDSKSLRWRSLSRLSKYSPRSFERTDAESRFLDAPRFRLLFKLLAGIGACHARTSMPTAPEHAFGTLIYPSRAMPLATPFAYRFRISLLSRPYRLPLPTNTRMFLSTAHISLFYSSSLICTSCCFPISRLVFVSLECLTFVAIVYVDTSPAHSFSHFLRPTHTSTSICDRPRSTQWDSL